MGGPNSETQRLLVVQSSVVKPLVEDDKDGKDGFDILLSTLGFGRWQWSALALMAIVYLTAPIHYVGISLLAAPLPFRCFHHPGQAVQESDIWSNESVSDPWYNNVCLSIEGGTYDGHNYTSIYLPPDLDYTGMATCPYVQYDTTIFSSTILSQFSLVCERGYLVTLYQMLYHLGGAVGSAFGGPISDRHGRLLMVKIGLSLSFPASLTLMLAPNIYCILAARFCLGIASLNFAISCPSIAMEMIPSALRSVVGTLVLIWYSIGVVILAATSYFIRDWQPLFLANLFPILLVLILYCFQDESPRWLLWKGRGQEALTILEKAVKQNKAVLKEPLTTIVENILKENDSNEDMNNLSQQSELSLLERFGEVWRGLRLYFSSPGMRTILLITPTLWFLQCFIYLGVSINANNFTSTNPFLYMALTGVMDGLSILLVTPLSAFMGRIKLITGGLFMGGTLFLLNELVPGEGYYMWVKWMMNMVGLVLVAGPLQVLNTFSLELFPTECRSRGYALIKLAACSGSLCAPYITTVVAQSGSWLTTVIFGCAGVVASLLVPFLPETNNQPMPETLQDVERRYRDTRRGTWAGYHSLL